MSSLQDDQDGANNRPGLPPRHRYFEGESTSLDNPGRLIAGEDTPSDNPIYYHLPREPRHRHRNRDGFRHILLKWTGFMTKKSMSWPRLSLSVLPTAAHGVSPAQPSSPMMRRARVRPRRSRLQKAGYTTSVSGSHVATVTEILISVRVVE